MRNFFVAALFVSGLTTVSANSIIFQENFEGASATINNDTTTGAPVFAGSQFTLTSGSVDLLGPGFYSQLCVSPQGGYCIDTTGAGDARGVLTSNDPIVFAPGNYALMFDLMGWDDQAGNLETATVEVSLGTLLDQSFFRDGSANPYTTVTIPFTVTDPTSASLVFADLGGSASFAGAILDNIEIDSVNTPEPASLLLAGTALAALGFLRKKRAI